MCSEALDGALVLLTTYPVEPWEMGCVFKERLIRIFLRYVIHFKPSALVPVLVSEAVSAQT